MTDFKPVTTKEAKGIERVYVERVYVHLMHNPEYTTLAEDLAYAINLVLAKRKEDDAVHP